MKTGFLYQRDVFKSRKQLAVLAHCLALTSPFWAVPAHAAPKHHIAPTKQKLLKASPATPQVAAPAVTLVPIVPPSTPLPPMGLAPEAAELAGHGHFVMSLIADRQGRTWVGTEDDGIFCYDPVASAGKRWHQYTTQDGLGDNNAYALCCDKLGRIWAGHQSHGVSVFNGMSWKNYDQMTGPLGARVFALTTCPTDGDIWIGTEAGLARYSLSRNTWKYYTTLDGLPSNQINALACDRNGTVFAGTDCDGMAYAYADDAYSIWHTVKGPGTLPNTATGTGLPSSLINCLLVTTDGEIFAGTPCGLAGSRDGKNWSFLRGADWEAKTKGLYVNRDFQPCLSAFEVVPQDVYRRVFTASQTPTASDKWISWQASATPKSQMGVEITGAGGQTRSVKAPVDLAGTSHPAPAKIYQSERFGDFTYTLSRLTPGRSYVVRLHFAELDYNGPGQRLFDVAINGLRVLHHFDIFQAAQGADRAVIRESIAQADAAGTLKISLDAPLDPGEAPKSASPVLSGALLSEDYVTSLVQDASGRVWVGHRQTGLEARDFHNGQIVPLNGKLATDYVSSLLPSRNGQIIVGGYGSELTLAQAAITTPASPDVGVPVVTPTVPLTFPRPALPPTAEELTTLRHRLADASTGTALLPGQGAYVGVDWVTKGDWVRNYGTRIALLCAAAAPLDHNILSDPSYSVTGDLGPHRTAGDSIRRWIHWLKTDQARVLYDPAVGYRRQAEWDDHGEAYPMSQQGPDLWATVTVPAGIHRLSAYIVNKDGHDNNNRFRDFLLELIPYRESSVEAEALPPLGQARIHNFWGGLYHSFVVCGPAKFYIRVSRNNSFNTLLSAILLDKISGPATEYETRRSIWLGKVTVRSQARVQSDSTSIKFAYKTATSRANASEGISSNASAILLLASALVQALDQSWDQQSDIAFQYPDRVFAYRAANSVLGAEKENANPASEAANDAKVANMLENWRRQINFWTPEDRENFVGLMAEQWQTVVKANPELKTANR